ncbi:MAG: putative lipid II flippase FtsW [Verrucomicrobiae bacterium]|nr:putative lipid II flippase FtsW [Verrucomicrobiae bacterium]MDW8343681.1 putative lipid II flippase FtsW [Verrucomicrobiae bacterium]
MNRAPVILVVVTLALVTLGVVMLFSTSAMYARDRYGDAHYLLKRQVVWLAIGMVACGLAANCPYPRLRVVAGVVLAVSVLLLVLVLVPGLGVKVGGARRWLSLAGMRFQPSELAKLALVLWLAHWLAREKRRLGRFGRGFLIPASVVAVVCGLILAEPDFGTTALVGAVAMGLIFVAGGPWRFWVPAIVLGATGFGVLVATNPVRAQRLMAFLDLEKYKAGAGYQVWQAIMAFGSGGAQGLGLGNSRQKMFYLPEAHTDFIFPIIGEELGLLGTLGVLGAFLALVISGIVISCRARDFFGQYLGFGLTLLLGLQALINIGVVTAWLPTKGLPLPFISFGGSNLLMSLTAVGLLLSIHRYGTEKTTTTGEEQEILSRQPEWESLASVAGQGGRTNE